MSITIVATHTIFPDIITRGATVIDCGANVGLFSAEMISQFGSICYAIEAVPDVYKKIPQSPNLNRFNFALCGRRGEVTLTVDDEDTTRSTIQENTRSPYQRKVSAPGRNLQEFLHSELPHRTIDVVKMDIEGAEIEVLASLDDELIKGVGQWTIEFHDELGLSSPSSVVNCIKRITDLGFYELFWSRRRNTADVLLVNKERLGLARYLSEQYIVRPLRAGTRLIKRTLNNDHRGAVG
jgi:FkbM family methyltransferase